MASTPRSSISVLLDFDGTITVDDIGDKLIKRFAAPGWEDAYRKLLAGELSIREAWAIEASHLNERDEAAMIAHAAQIAEIRPGLGELVKFAGDSGVELEVVSSGFHFYVDAALAKAGLHATPRARPTVRWESDGRGVLTFDSGTRDCASTALCKCDRIWSHRRHGRYVVYVGDGLSDTCAATQADLLLARGELAEIARNLNVEEFRTFEDFFDVRREVERLLDETPRPQD